METKKQELVIKITNRVIEVKLEDGTSPGLFYFSDEPVEVSDWEFGNWAIQIVINYIKEQGFQLLSYCDMPGVDPQIWFKNTEGKNCWIEVLPITPGNKPAFSIDGFPPSFLQYDGYAAEVSFAPIENTKIYRAKGADVDFEGIKKIHDA